MANAKIDEFSKDVEELKKLSEVASRSKVKDILLIETRKIETEITKLRELEAAAIKNGTNKPSSTPVPSHNPTKCYNVQITNYAWDQSDKFIKIYVDLTDVQNIPADKVNCQFNNCGMTLTVSELNNRNYTLTLKDLCKSIVPETSHWKVKKDKVIVFMNKKMESVQWSSLTSKPEAKKPDMDPNADPSESIMGLMKQLYEDGDDEMKRTIAKAWTSSRDKQVE